jgi:hypothetical protein
MSRRGRPSDDGGYDARVLALKLVEVCERSGAANNEDDHAGGLQ